MRISNVKNLKSYVIQQYPNEACGIVEDGVFVPCKNIATDPTMDFKIDGSVYQHHKVDAVIHSHLMENKHPDFDARTPSMADMVGQVNTAVPWGIVATDGENVTDPVWWGLDKPIALDGRNYVPSIHDCLTLACDYLKIHKGITLPIVPRPPIWDSFKKTMIVDGIEPFGMKDLGKDVPINSLQEGDFILFSIQANYVNHVGVIDADGMLFHHLQNRLPRREHLGKWQKQVVTVLRHRSLM